MLGGLAILDFLCLSGLKDPATEENNEWKQSVEDKINSMADIGCSKVIFVLIRINRHRHRLTAKDNAGV